MSRLVFGNYPVDMLEPEYIGFAQFFPSPEMELVTAGVGLILTRDPLSGATVAMHGLFDFSSEAALLNSRAFGMTWKTGTGELLLDWSGSIRVGDALNAANTEALIPIALGGDDEVLGTDGADVLRAAGGGDTVMGKGGDDALFGDAGNDLLDGGEGVDGARFLGVAGSFVLTRDRLNLGVSDKTGIEGSDTLVSIERLQFADKAFDLVNPPRTSVPAYNTNNGFLFDAVLHYFASGAAQGKSPSSWFDATWYENRWPDLTPHRFDDATLFMHYNLYGVWEGRSAGPAFDQFDGNRYLADSPDVAAYVDAHLPDFLGSRSNGAIAHYVIYGQHELRPAFDLVGQPIDLGYAIDLGI